MRIFSLGHIQEEKRWGHLFILTNMCQNALWIVLMALLPVSRASFIFRSIIYLRYYICYFSFPDFILVHIFLVYVFFPCLCSTL